MKRFNILYLLAIIMMSAACKKSENGVFTPSGNLLVANAVVGGSTLTYNSTNNTVGNNAFAVIPVAEGQAQVAFSDKTVTPIVPYYNQVIPVTNSGNYTLFLAGNSASAVEPILVTETYKNYKDSLCGIRFINLSPTSAGINVNIKGSTTNEVSNLAYKAYSPFKQYPAKKVNTSYVFELRNNATNAVITTYTLTTPYFRNVTIMLRGRVGGSPAAGATLVTHP